MRRRAGVEVSVRFGEWFGKVIWQGGSGRGRNRRREDKGREEDKGWSIGRGG